MVGFGPRIVYEIPIFDGIPLSDTVVNTWIIMAILITFAVMASKRLETVPRGFQNATETIVEFISNLTAQTMGSDKLFFVPYMGTLFLFLVFANLWGLIGLRQPTADINTTFALAILTFIAIHFFGAKRKGVGTYLKGFLEPLPFLLPMNIMSELSTPISLAFRLFGNMVGGFIIIGLLYSALTSFSSMIGLSFFPILQAGAPVFFHLYFDLFSGVLHSFIFVMLSMVFISIAMD
ncbi:F0F1 ATP synthase subunit A [Alkaliphilus peptidifermentans]|uniref:ATP synthase subunit a n=1 Tax=Alkaliphilus peptidifermentans DSM 18978 TaxID=1120976 RepID=A0A1G5JGU4_9FIRM|nr:F0F1 ATP synthase subunit A [Alkaliphilus peptidifermentans]SCY87517.1 ATP synthase F0 subcomplex A subunit [Alkaliphilus peptidifermentans DSM 18978]